MTENQHIITKSGFNKLFAETWEFDVEQSEKGVAVIKSGYEKVGLFPFNPEKVMKYRKSAKG